MRVEIQQTPIVDKEDQYRTLTVPAKSGNMTDTAPFKLLSFTTRHGRRGYIRSLGNAVAAGGESVLTFRLLFNGAFQYPYDGSQDQWGDPAHMQDLPQRIEVPQGTLVEVQVDNSDPTDDFAATARIWMDYE